MPFTFERVLNNSSNGGEEEGAIHDHYMMFLKLQSRNTFNSSTDSRPDIYDMYVKRVIRTYAGSIASAQSDLTATLSACM